MLLLSVLFLSIFNSSLCHSTADCSWKYGRIQCFGDSHCAHFFTNTNSFLSFLNLAPAPGKKSESQYEKSDYFYNKHNIRSIPFGVHWLGPQTMFRIGRDGINVTDYDVDPQDILVFVFGEIDIRIHIGQQVYRKHRRLDQVVEELTQSYIASIAKNKKLFGSRLYVLEVIPPKNFDKKFCPDLSWIPTACIDERINFTLKLNSRLKEKCEQENITFIELPIIIKDSKNGLNPLFSDQTVHINPKYNHHIKDILIERILQKE